MAKARVSRLKSWFEPRSVSLSAMPSALQETTESDPISEQMSTYTSRCVRP